MTREEFVTNAIKDQGFTLKSFSEKIEMSYTTLLSILKEGSLGGAAVDRVSKICRGIGITIDELVSISEEPTTSGISTEEKSLLSLFRNSDDRARTDAIMLLKYHQRTVETAEPSFLETANKMSAKAIEQNSHNNDLAEAK